MHAWHNLLIYHKSDANTKIINVYCATASVSKRIVDWPRNCQFKIPPLCCLLILQMFWNIFSQGFVLTSRNPIFFSTFPFIHLSLSYNNALLNVKSLFAAYVSQPHKTIKPLRPAHKTYYGSDIMCNLFVSGTKLNIALCSFWLFMP